jgi:hypothetical protein
VYYGSLETSRIIEAFRRNVPGCYVRDYRDKGGFITICRDYKDIPWRDQITTTKTYRQVPAVTLASLPRGNVTSATLYRGIALERTGWRIQFRNAMRHLTERQMRRITEFLGMGEVFPGIV